MRVAMRRTLQHLVFTGAVALGVLDIANAPQHIVVTVVEQQPGAVRHVATHDVSLGRYDLSSAPSPVHERKAMNALVDREYRNRGKDVHAYISDDGMDVKAMMLDFLAILIGTGALFLLLGRHSADERMAELARGERAAIAEGAPPSWAPTRDDAAAGVERRR